MVDPASVRVVPRRRVALLLLAIGPAMLLSEFPYLLGQDLCVTLAAWAGRFISSCDIEGPTGGMYLWTLLLVVTALLGGALLVLPRHLARPVSLGAVLLACCMVMVDVQIHLYWLWSPVFFGAAFIAIASVPFILEPPLGREATGWSLTLWAGALITLGGWWLVGLWASSISWFGGGSRDPSHWPLFGAVAVLVIGVLAGWARARGPADPSPGAPEAVRPGAG
jgi:hypothetical protein